VATPGAGRATDLTRLLALLTAEEPGRRNRRTIDGVLLAVGSVAAAFAAVAASSAPTQDRHVGRGVITALGWAEAFWRVAFVSALALAVLVTADVLIRGRWLLARDQLAAVALVGPVGFVLGRAVDSDWFPLKDHVLARWAFPELRLATATALLVVAGPELVRPVRRVAASLVPLAALAAVALGAARPSEALGGLALGLGAAAVVRLAFGTAAGVPPTERIRAELGGLGVTTSDLQPAGRQHVGSAEYVGHDRAGQPLRARVLGRDAQDTQRLARRWRALAYRDPPRSAAVGRVEQVEHEALATLLAAKAGVRVPGVVTAALAEGGDAIIVTQQADIGPLEESLPDEVSDEVLLELWKHVAMLHGAGISHGRLNGRNVAVADGKPVLLDFSAATLGAPKSALDIDVAELLVACTVLVGPDRALHAACEGSGKDAVAAALPYLERAALTPHTRDLARSHEVELKTLRTAAATLTGSKPPEIVPLRRVRPRDFVYTALVAFAAYFLITKLAKIGFATIGHELRRSDLVWVAVALLLAQLSYVPQAISLRGAVMTPLPLLPCVVLESASKFLNLTVPGSAGTIALNIRFLQRMGASTGEAVASGAIDGLSDTIVQVLLVLSILPFTRFDFNTSELSGALPSGRFVAAIFGGLAVLIAIVLSIPKVRAKVVPSVKDALRSLKAVASSRQKLIELFGGAIGKEVLFALTLGAAARAYGVHLGLGQLVLINVVASTLAGLVPVPGGIGAAEAGIAGGLVAMGVPESEAFTIALTHRLCTYYLPPIWGYASLEWLRRKGHV
jgi:uncharacterized protein (TIRG00374 family)